MVEYDKRKIIRVGEKSYAITIPKKWILDLKLNSGVTVDLVYDGKVITIKPPRTIVQKQDTSFYYLTLDLTGGSEKLAREVTVAYTEGIRSIRVVGDKNLTNNVVRELQNKLIGLVTVEDKPNTIETNIVFLDADINVESVIVRIASLITEILDNILEYLNKPDKNTLEEVKTVVNDIDKLYYLGLRLCKNRASTTIGTDTLETVDHILYLNNVKYLTKTIEKLVLLIKEQQKRKTIDEVRKQIIHTKKIIQDSIKAYIENNINQALKTLEIGSKTVKELKKKTTLTNNIISHLTEIALEIAEITVAKCIRDKACRIKYLTPKK